MEMLAFVLQAALAGMNSGLLIAFMVSIELMKMTLLFNPPQYSDDCIVQLMSCDDPEHCLSLLADVLLYWQYYTNWIKIGLIGLSIYSLGLEEPLDGKFSPAILGFMARMMGNYQYLLILSVEGAI